MQEPRNDFEMAEDLQETSVQIKVLFFKMKIWWLIMIGLQSFILMFMLIGLGADRWVKNGSGDAEWKGGLLFVTDASSSYMKGKRYSDAADSALGDYEDIYKDLAGAGATFAFFEVIAYIATLIWMIKTCFLLIETRFLKPFFGYIWPVIGLSCHILAEIIWTGVSGASFGADCENTVEDIKLCAIDGPGLVLFITIVYLITAALFVFLYLKKGGKKPDEQDPRESARE